MKTNIHYSDFDEIVKRVLAEIEKEERELNETGSTPVDNSFEITHREFMAKSYESGNDVYGKVKAHILRKTRLDCLLYHGSIKSTSEATGVSKSTVQRVFDSYQEDDLMRKYCYGVWALHPKYLRKGSGGKYMALLRIYYSLPRKGERG